MKKHNQKILIPLWPDSAMSTPFVADPFGSYTGVPENPEEQPMQDADDL